MTALDATSDAPLLVLSGARLELADGTRLPELEATVSGRRIALIGSWSPFYRLLAGEIRLAGGRALILGSPAAKVVRNGTAGLALSDPPLPRTWTATRYLAESGRLLGWAKQKAEVRARELLTSFELAHLTTRTLASLPVVERRVLLIAHATLGDPKVLCVEAPFDRLDADAAAYVNARLERALEGRSGIVHFPAPSLLGPERAFIDRAEGVLVLAGGHVIVNAPAKRASPSSTRVLVTVTRHAGAFRARLETQGLSVLPAGHLAALLPLLTTPENAELARFLVELPAPLDTSGILEASRAAEAPLVELSPLDVSV